MKITVIAFTLVCLLASNASAQEANQKKYFKLYDGKPHTKEIQLGRGLENAISFGQGTWWDKHYVNGLGLAPFDTNIVAIPKPVVNSPDSPIVGFRSDDGKNKFKYIKEEKDKYYYPLSDVIPGRRIDGKDMPWDWHEGHNDYEDLDDHRWVPLFLFRVQDDLVSKPFDAKPATVLWQNDGVSGRQETMFNAALLVDMYFAGIGRFGRYSSNGMTHFLMGAEVERFDSGRATPDIDIRRYTMVAEFSPGGLLGIRDPNPSKPRPRQTMTLGWLYEDDLISDAQRHSFQIQYAPTFKLPALNLLVGERSYFKKALEFFSPNEVSENLQPRNLAGAPSAITQGDKADGARNPGATDPEPTGADKRGRAAWDAGWAASATPKGYGIYKHFFYVRPKLGIDYGQASVSSLLSGDLPDLNAVYTLESGFSFFKETYHLGYRLSGYTGITDGGTNLLHEFFAQVTPHGWPGRLFATYKKGKLAPNFSQVDVFQVGLGFKF